MDIERETVVEALLALAAVVLFVAVLLVAGSMGGQGLTRQGAYTVVGGIVAFVLVMSGFGFWLSTRE